MNVDTSGFWDGFVRGQVVFASHDGLYVLLEGEPVGIVLPYTGIMIGEEDLPVKDGDWFQMQAKPGGWLMLSREMVE